MEINFPSPPGLSQAEVKYLDKVDMQTLTEGLVFWQDRAETLTEEILTAFNNLAEFYRDTNTGKTKIMTRRIIAGEIEIKEIDTLGIYLDKNQNIYETNIKKLEQASGSVYDLLFTYYEKLYKMRPESEPENEKVSAIPPALQQPGQSNIIIENNQPKSAGFLSFFKRQEKAKNFAVDDILSPYRRARDILEEIKNTPNMGERLNSFHGYAMMDVQLGQLLHYQQSRKIIEVHYLNTWVRPKLLKMVEASNTLKIIQEQQVQQGVLTRFYESAERHRPSEFTQQN